MDFFDKLKSPAALPRGISLYGAVTEERFQKSVSFCAEPGGGQSGSPQAHREEARVYHETGGAAGLLKYQLHQQHVHDGAARNGEQHLSLP